MSEEGQPTGERGAGDGGRAAFDNGLRLLAARPLTVAELRRRLASRGHDEADVDAALERLARLGYLDDLRLARHYIVTRSRRLGHGRLRLTRELEARGAPPATVAEAWRAAVEDDEIDPGAILRDEVRRRVEQQGGALDRRAYRRVYNALLRAGFDASELAAELESHRRFSEPAADLCDGNNHEFP